MTNENFAVKGDVKPITDALFEVENPCLCGCGQMVPMYDEHNKRRYFVNHHHVKSIKHSGDKA